MRYDFVSIGDITTDAFIHIKDARVNCDIDDKNCLLCVRFGDKIPYESVTVVPAVGNSPNAAVSAHRLGLNAALASNLGDDRNGSDCLNALKHEGVSTEYVTVHEGKETNYHYVLRYEAERTILVKHHEYEYALPRFQEPPTWLYLSSLGENSLPFHDDIAAYVKESGTKLAFQPGTFQMKQGKEALKEIYEVSELFFCNKEEAGRILKTEASDIKALLEGMHDLGPKIVVITEGPDGANTYDGKEFWHMPMYPDPAPPIDRTGAGDAFASTFSACLGLSLSIPEALKWAPINSMSVVQHIGAQKGLLSREEIEEWLRKAPAEYEPVRF